MTLTKKRLIVSVFIVVIMVVFTNNPVFARATFNYTDGGFCVPCDPCDPCEGGTSGGSSLSGVKTTSSLAALIIEGAGQYMKAYSSYLLVANKVEMSDLYGVNYDELSELITQAIDDTQLTLYTYISLVDKANGTAYNQNVINQLVEFDYHGFKLEKGLNTTIFRKVYGYLSEGDIRGSYAYVIPQLENILATLFEMKSLVQGKQLPENKMIWRVNQVFSETLLFGQYNAEVFYRVLVEG